MGSKLRYSGLTPPEITDLLKGLIVFLLIGVIASLFSGLVFLFKDSDRNDSKRTLYALGVRVTFAGALLLAILYGFLTGELRLGTSAPWHDYQAPSVPSAGTED